MPTSAGIFFTTAREDYLNNPDGSDTNYYGVPPNDTLIPMSFACPKAFETINGNVRWWNSAEGFDALRKNYSDQSIGVLPWVIPKGQSMALAYAEGQAAAQTLQHLGGFQQIDLEPGAPYWVGGEAEIDEFGRGVAENGGGEMVLLPDSRADKLAIEHFWYWYSRPWISRRVHPQAYSSIFYTPRPGRQKRGIDDATRALLAGGVERQHIFPVLSTSDNDGLNPISGEELVEGILYCKEQGFGGFFIWRRGFATPEQFAAMQALDDPWAPVPPPPGPSEWEQALARLNAASIEQRSATEEVLRLAPVK